MNRMEQETLFKRTEKQGLKEDDAVYPLANVLTTFPH